MRPRTTLGAAILAAVVALGACGGGGGGGGSGSAKGGTGSASNCALGQLAKATAPVNITFWHAMTAQNEVVLKQLVDRFNGSQQKVHVNLSFQGSYEETLNKYIAAARGNQKPDLVQVYDIGTRLMWDSGTALPAQTCVDADHYDLSTHVKRVLDYYTIDGKLGPMPFNTSTMLIYYNKKAFEKAGLDPNKPPATLDEVKADSQKIVQSGAAKHGIALELKGDFVEQWFGRGGRPLVDQDNGRSGRATKVLLDDPVGSQIFAFEKDMIGGGLALNVGANASGRDNFLSIPSGNAAMTFGTSAALGTVFNVLSTSNFPNVALGVGPYPSPTTADAAGGTLVGGGALWIVKGGDAVKQAASYTFAKWLNEPQQQAEWSAGTGYIAVDKRAVDLPPVTAAWAKQPELKVAWDELNTGPNNTATAGAAVGAYPQVRAAIANALERMATEGLDAKAALAQATKDADAAIKDYNERTGG